MQNTIIPNIQTYRPSFRGNFTTLEKNMIHEVKEFALKNKNTIFYKNTGHYGICIFNRRKR